MNRDRGSDVQLRVKPEDSFKEPLAIYFELVCEDMNWPGCVR